MTGQEEIMLLEKIKNGNEKAFEILFRRYYPFLCLLASKYTGNEDDAEEIVQDFFVKLWEKKEQITINTSVKNYLFSAIKNQCLNFIQHKKIQSAYIQNLLSENNLNKADEFKFPETALIDKIEKSISSLPEKRKKIFLLSREKGLKYKEIAEILNISVKTVETQMGLALKTLRKELKDFLM